MKFQLFPILLVLLVTFFSGCSSENSRSSNEGLTVSAAVSLKDAFTEIRELYKTKTGKTVNFNFGASGAPIDVFASAGEKQMDELAAKNLIDADSRRDFARNKLVLIVPQNSNLNLENFDGLSELKVQKIAVGNPKTVSAGQESDSQNQFFSLS